MKSDVNGCSTTKAGQEQYEFFTNVRGNEMVQYDYRITDGKLFSTVAKSLEKARSRRDKWLERQEA